MDKLVIKKNKEIIIRHRIIYYSSQDSIKFLFGSQNLYVDYHILEK